MSSTTRCRGESWTEPGNRKAGLGLANSSRSEEPGEPRKVNQGTKELLVTIGWRPRDVGL